MIISCHLVLVSDGPIIITHPLSNISIIEKERQNSRFYIIGGTIMNVFCHVNVFRSNLC